MTTPRVATRVAMRVAMHVALLFAALMRPAVATAGTLGTPPALQRVHTDTLWAQSLGVRKALTVYLPPSYATSPGRRYPLLVYLHGLGGNERNWVDAGALATTLDSLARAGNGEAIVVMPDGDDGWYTTWNALNAPRCAADTVRREPAATFCVPWLHYDDYIAHDVVRHADARYRTVAARRSRGIAGLSMGGYGAVSLALSYPHIFGAAASHSGVVSPRYLGPRPFAQPPSHAADSTGLRIASSWLWPYMAPAFGRDTIGWTARDPGRMAERLVARERAVMPALYIDCGVDDAFIDQNRDLHATLTRLGIPHRYAELPGKHDWTYWRTHAATSAAFLLDATSAR